MEVKTFILPSRCLTTARPREGAFAPTPTPMTDEQSNQFSVISWPSLVLREKGNTCPGLQPGFATWAGELDPWLRCQREQAINGWKTGAQQNEEREIRHRGRRTKYQRTIQEEFSGNTAYLVNLELITLGSGCRPQTLQDVHVDTHKHSYKHVPFI